MSIILNSDMSLDYKNINGNVEPAKFSGVFPVDTNGLPAGLVHLNTHPITGSILNLIFQRPPHRRYVKISSVPKMNVNTYNSETFNLRIPWTVYVYSEHYGGVQIFGTKSRTSLSPDEPLYPLMFPNMYNNGAVCTPRTLMDHLYYSRADHVEVINSIYTGIWDSGFNMDTYENLGAVLTEEFFDFYKSWELTTSFESILQHALFSERAYDNIGMLVDRYEPRPRIPLTNII